MSLKMEGVENALLKPLANNKWLRSGAQTTLHPTALNAVKEIRARATDFHSLIAAVDSKIRELEGKNSTRFSREYFLKRFRRETVQDYFNGGQYFACGGQTIVACALLRALGIPAKYVERLYKDGTFSGHVVVKLRHPNGRWVYYDPTKSLLSATNQSKFIDGRETIPFREGLDSHDIGIKTGQKLKAECDKLRTKFTSKR